MSTQPGFRCFAVSFLSMLVAACGGGGGGGGPLPPTLSFGAPDRYPTGGLGGRDLWLADVTQDGIVDALISNGDQASVSLLPGVLTGGFAGGQLLPAPGQAGPLAVGDLNADRLPDLAVASVVAGDVITARNRGAAAFAPPVSNVLTAPARDLRIGDVTGDGRADVIVAHQSVPSLSVLVGDGAGGTTATQVIGLSAQPGDLVLGDCNGDSRLDLVTVGPFGSQVQALLADGAGGFQAPVNSPVPLQSGVLSAADIDRDGNLDLVALDFQRTTVVVLRGNGTGQFSVTQTRTLPGVGAAVVAVDLDVNGAVDLVAAVDRQVIACYGDGAGAFGAPEVLVTDSAAISVLVAGEFTRDGLVDLAYLVGADVVALLKNPRPVPLGIAHYGAGTADCAGTIGLTANGVPRVGNASFAFLGSNAPADTVGFLLLGGPPDLAGSDSFGLGFNMHLGFGLLVTRFIRSDLHGTSVVREPIPATTSLAGLALYAQQLWQGRAGQSCSPSSILLSSSRGLAVTIQP